MKNKIIFFYLFVFSSPIFAAQIQLSKIKSIDSELRKFTELSGMTSNFKALAPASSLGIWGVRPGIEFTTIPQGAFQVFENTIELPSVFPRLNIAKGLTPNLDLEISALIPALFPTQLRLPEEVKNLLLLGAGAKYTLLNESEFPFSMAARISYTRLNLDFFHSDIYGADLSASRTLEIPFVGLALTPYVGAGYVSINGAFLKNKVLTTNLNHQIQDYRYFTGLSTRLFIFSVIGQADFANPRAANTYSLKLGLDLF